MSKTKRKKNKEASALGELAKSASVSFGPGEITTLELGRGHAATDLRAMPPATYEEAIAAGMADEYEQHWAQRLSPEIGGARDVYRPELSFGKVVLEKKKRGR